jgi:predicted nucleic-acid-binding protein
MIASRGDEAGGGITELALPHSDGRMATLASGSLEAVMDDGSPRLTADEAILESVRALTDGLPRSQAVIASQLHTLIDKAEALLRAQQDLLRR